MSKKLRAEVDRKLGYPLNEEEWNILVEFGYVRDGDFDSFDVLLTRARELSIGRHRSERSRVVPLPPVTAGGSLVSARARALSQLVADEAGGDPSLVDYRARHLGGGVITFEKARDLLESPAARGAPSHVLNSRGVAVLGHRSRIIRTEPADCGRGWPDCDHEWVEYEIDVKGTKTQIRTLDVPHRRQVLVYQSGDRPELIAGVGNGSPLDELRELSDALSGAYRWRPGEAAAFVLEGSVPYLRPIEVQTSFHVAATGRSQTTIALKVDPAVAASEVARAYSQAQRVALRQSPKATNPRTMAAVAFVAERKRDQPNLSWRDLVSSFNAFWATHDGEKPEPFHTASAFQQAVVRGRTSLRDLAKLPPQGQALLELGPRHAKPLA